MENHRVLVSCALGKTALERLKAEDSVELVVDEISDEAILAEKIAGFHALVVRSNVTSGIACPTLPFWTIQSGAIRCAGDPSVSSPGRNNRPVSKSQSVRS